MSNSSSNNGNSNRPSRIDAERQRADSCDGRADLLVVGQEARESVADHSASHFDALNDYECQQRQTLTSKPVLRISSA
jgi:hypothetical protein